MTDLTHLISSAQVPEQCPRELLGLQCISDFYKCFCTEVAASRIDPVSDESGKTTALRLTLTVKPNADVTEVLYGLELTSLKGYVGGKGNVIEMLYDLSHPLNYRLTELGN